MSIPKEYNIRYGYASLKGIATSEIASVIDDDMALGERIRDEREKRGWSQADLARRVGVSQVTINKIENGQTVKSKWLPEIMVLLNIPIAGSLPEEPPEAPLGDIAISRHKMPLDIPVKGVAVGGDDADFSFNGTISEYVRRPPGLTRSNGVYAVHVVSDSMAPRFDPNDLLYVSSLKMPVPGDYVIVELHANPDGSPGKGYVKRLVRRSGTKITLRQFNPANDFDVDAATVLNVHRVFTNNELFGL